MSLPSLPRLEEPHELRPEGKQPLPQGAEPPFRKLPEDFEPGTMRDATVDVTKRRVEQEAAAKKDETVRACPSTQLVYSGW